jgi:cytochrome P450/NADPH-cytochrome P450 reductase
MILQRFKLIDHQRYKLDLKETLTVKPEGFKIKVRARSDKDRASAGPAPAVTTSAAARAPIAAAARPGHNTPLLVLYGSNLGTAEELAHKVADLATLNGFSTTFATMDDYAGKLPTSGGVVLFCSSYNGAAPDNATQFVKWLNSDHPADALKGVRFAMFGCGNSDWAATYQSVPRQIDERLAALGAKRVAPRGEGDARTDLDSHFETWFAALRPLAAKEFGIETTFTAAAGEGQPLYAVEQVAPSVPNIVASTAGAKPMKVLANRELQNREGANASDRSTRHIEVQLPEGVTYRVGDHLSIVPRNDPALVDRVARRFGFVPADTIKLQVAEGRRAQLPAGQVISVGRLLTEFLELQQVATRKQLQAMAEHTRCPMTRPKLMAYVGDDEAAQAKYRDEVMAKRKSVFNLMEEFPACELPFNVFLEMMSLLSPRYYSISSSPLVDAGKCSVSIGVVEGPALSGKGAYKGVCSTFMAARGPGDIVQATIKETKAGFRLPDNAATPIIMIGPGTGLAPFRGFLQERDALAKKGRALGPALLFFGCRHPDQDFIYADELKDFAARGLTELHVAFSRHGEKKTYVQHLIAEQAERVWSLMEQGAIVYVCGDGSKMEPDVKAALMKIYAGRTGSSEAQAEGWIERMGTENRYVLDVWAGG